MRDTTQTSIRSVPDTNIILASQKAGENSPNKEYFERWGNEEFELLFSQDTLSEYIEKLQEKNIPTEQAIEFISRIIQLGIQINIQYFHLPYYPEDSDDIAFLLCADNGQATHIVSYDKHLLHLEGHYPFKICKPVPFLKDLRHKLNNN